MNGPVQNFTAEETTPHLVGRDAETTGERASSPVSSLEPGLWTRLSESSDLPDMIRAWLALLCRSIEGASRGVVLLASVPPGSFEAVAFWPDGSGGSPLLTEAAQLALQERRGVASGDAGQGVMHVAFPILLGDERKGVVAVGLRGATAEQAKSALRNLQWGAAWIRERLLRVQDEELQKLLLRSRAALDLLGEALGREGFKASAMAVVTGLAVRSQCTRVSLGIRARNTVAVKAISHTAQFQRRMLLVSGISAAMDEALDQRCIILYPAPADQVVSTAAHADLSRAQQDANILTIPMLVGDSYVGALTFERPSDAPFDDHTIELLELTTSVVGPILEEKRRNDRWLIVKAMESLRRQVIWLVGPGHPVRKLVVAAALIGALALSLIQGVYAVNADAQIEGLVRRAVVSPYDGFIKDSKVRAGDVTKEGDVLATLEDRDLVLERLKWVTERQQKRYEYDKALAARQPADINIIRAQIDQADARIELLDEQLERVKLRSPIDGQIVSGDLSQLIGSSVQRGQVLFEIAPLNAYRINLFVDEREVGRIEPGQAGKLVVSALPSTILPFVVDQVTPIADARNGRNVFRVEGRLTENPPQLRPGMEGVGKVEIGKRNIAWIWLHPLIDPLRLWSWQWVR